MFPLYDDLKRNCKPDKISSYKTDVYLKSVKEVTDKEAEIILALILTHYIKNETSEKNKNKNEITNKIPYEGTYSSTLDILFNFSKFPPLLQQILFRFVKLHIKSKKKVKKESGKINRKRNG